MSEERIVRSEVEINQHCREQTHEIREFYGSRKAVEETDSKSLKLSHKCELMLSTVNQKTTFNPILHEWWNSFAPFLIFS